MNNDLSNTLSCAEPPEGELPAFLSSLLRFHWDAQEAKSPRAVLAAAQSFFMRLGCFRSMAFYLTEPPDWEFQLAHCFPDDAGTRLESAVEEAIERGMFARALRENRPATFHSALRSDAPSLVLHGIGTRSRACGMLAGELSDAFDRPAALPASLISLVMAHCASALENQRFQAELLRHNRGLREAAAARASELVRTIDALRNEAAARRRSARALAEEQERIRSALRPISEGVMTTDPRGRVESLNPAAERLLGVSFDEAVGRSLESLFELPETSGIHPKRLFNGPGEGGEGLDTRLRGPRTARGGRFERPLAVASSAIRHQGRLLGAVLIVREDVEGSPLEVGGLRASKIESVGAAACDLTRQLAVVIGNLSLAAGCSEQPEKTNGRLRDALDAALGAKSLAEELLAFARTELAPSPLICDPVERAPR